MIDDCFCIQGKILREREWIKKQTLVCQQDIGEEFAVKIMHQILTT